MSRVGDISIENAKIGFKNFAGNEGPYNQKGDRNFVVFLDPEHAEELSRIGWNVKFPKAKQDIDPEEDTRQPYVEVSVSFKYYPPKVVLITGDNVTKLEEQDLDMLDWAEISNIDLILRPYQWAVSGATGIKAYLKSIYVTLVTDAFTSKYGV